MKNKIIIILIVVVIILGAGFAVYFIKKNKSTAGIEGNSAQNQNSIPEELSSKNDIAGNTQTANEEQLQNKIVTDDFSITLPMGWSKTIDTMPGVAALAANPNEKINDAAAEKINFKSYLAISPDTLSGKNLEEYTQSVKSEIQKSVSGTVFSNENALTINKRSARAIEAEMTQQGVNFKVLIVIINGDGDNVWVLSYNTTKSSWDGYKEYFAGSANSFVVKNKN